MKVKLSKIINSKDALTRLLKEKLPVKTAYSVQKNFRNLEHEFNSYETARTELIIEKYGKEDVEGSGNWKVPPDSMDAFSKELLDFLSMEVDVEVMSFALPDTFNISPEDLFLLEWILEDLESKEEE